MAAGTPVVASDLPPVREIVDDGIDGVLVPADRPAALARAIRILHDYPEHAQRIGDAARAKATRSFDWQQSLRSLKKVYDGLGASTPGSPSRDNDFNALMEGP
jgi:glycosyltransferase involved in cell wall biosynthesis